MFATLPRYNDAPVEPALAVQMADHFEPLVRRLRWTFRLNEEDAKDAASEAIRDILCGKPKYDPQKGSLWTLLWRVGSCRARDTRRRNRRHAYVDLDSAPEAAGALPGPVELRLRRAMGLVLDWAAALLSPEEAEAVELVVVDRLKPREAARRMHVPVSLVYRVKYNALAKMREFLCSSERVPVLVRCELPAAKRRGYGE